MADIIMCVNNECKVKNKCYRFTAKAIAWQSYLCFKPNVNSKKCRNFIPNKKEKNNG